MIRLIVQLRDGSEQALEPAAGLTVMEAIRDAGVDELLALCGGCCSCATCHVYVDDGVDGLSAMGPDEDDLLDSSEHRKPTSRLSCQLRLDHKIAALRVTIAPED